MTAEVGRQAFVTAESGRRPWRQRDAGHPRLVSRWTRSRCASLHQVVYQQAPTDTHVIPCPSLPCPADAQSLQRNLVTGSTFAQPMVLVVLVPATQFVGFMPNLIVLNFIVCASVVAVGEGDCTAHSPHACPGGGAGALSFRSVGCIHVPMPSVANPFALLLV